MTLTAMARGLSGLALVGALLLGASLPARAQAPLPPPSPSAGSAALEETSPGSADPGAPGSGGTRATAIRSATAVQGSAWRADNSPVPRALLRLRNVVTGRIEAMTVADEHGQFAFDDMPGGTYLVELVSEAGKVLAVGHTFTLAAGETVATLVRLGPKVRWSNGFFGTAALAVAASAGAVGVMAMSPEAVTSVSPNR